MRAMARTEDRETSGQRSHGAFHYAFDLYAFDEAFRPPAAADPVS